MSNILIVYDFEEPTNIEVTRFFKLFTDQYGGNMKSVKTMSVKACDLVWCDIVVFVRSQSMMDAYLASILKNMGRLCVLSLDDDLFALDNHKLRRPIQEKALKSVIRLSDVLLSGNDILAHRIQKRNHKIRYIRVDTIIEESELNINEEYQEQLKVVYYSSQGSSRDFDEVVRPAIGDIERKIGQRIDWTFFVVHPQLGDINGSTEYIGRLPYYDFKSRLRNGQYSFGIAPLRASEQGACKYINKFIEYTLAGLPCIYSDVEPYHSFIESGVNGLLADNKDQGAWADAFCKMADESNRKKYITNAQQQVRCQFSKEVILGNIKKELPELCTYKAEASIRFLYLSLFAAHVKNIFYRIADPFFRAYGRLKIEGLGSVIKWVWNHYMIHNC